MKKKLTLLFTLMLSPLMASADAININDIYYNLDFSTKTAEVTSNPDKYSGSFDIPASVTFKGTDYNVTSIGSNAFYGCSGLTSVTIPNSVKSIGYEAFYNCSKLTSVTIPNSVTSIGSYAFEYCKGLTSIEIPNSVTSIGESAFRNCSGLTQVTLNSNDIISKSYSSSSAIGSIFGSQVKEYILGDDVTSIGSYAFYECSGLTSVTIPNSVASIGNYAFFSCSGLTSVTIPNSVRSIAIGAFAGCSGLTSIEIPNSVTSIGSLAFNGCSGLTSVTIPNSVASIGSYAFQSCSKLTSVTIPNSVRSIGDYAFSYCSGLTSMSVENGNEKYDSRNNCNAIIETASNTLIAGCKNTVIPNSVRSIAIGAFAGCSGLTSIEIPNSVTSIGRDAFQNCKSLTSATIGNSVTSIGNYAFEGCSGLTQVTLNSNDIVSKSYSSSSTIGSIFGSQVKEYILGDDVKSIGSYAFYGRSGLISITIPNSVTSIGSRAFSGCSGLTSMSVENGNEKYDSRNNCNAIIETASSTLIVGCKNTVIPNSVRSIAIGAFAGCSGLTSIEIPNSVTSIGNEVFENCSGLTKVTLNSNAIASKSYSSSSTLGNIFGSQVKEYVLGDDVTSIGSYAFYNCSNVTSVTIADNVTSVGDYAFDGTAWYNNLPDGLFYAGKIAYKYQGTMPENTSMIIKEGTVKLNDNLFDGCNGLTSLYIPSSVKSIGNNAFANCSELLDVYCYIRKSPTVGTKVFDNSGIQFATLYVPEASLNGYKVTEPWSGFGDIKALFGEYPEVPKITKCATPIIIFENGKLSFSCETEGARFVCNFSTPSESYEEGVAVNMPNKLQVSVYAKKDGFENSDVATKEIDLGTSGIRGDVNGDGVVNMPDAMFIVNKILNGKFPDE